MAETPAPCVRALQRILCEDMCYPPRTEDGLVPGGDCFPDAWGVAGVFSSCDDGEGYCPTPDCIYYGPCICACHPPREEES